MITFSYTTRFCMDCATSCRIGKSDGLPAQFISDVTTILTAKGAMLSIKTHTHTHTKHLAPKHSVKARHPKL